MYAIKVTIACASRPSCPALCDRLLCDQRLLIQGEASREKSRAAGFLGYQPPCSPQVNEKLRPIRRYSSHIVSLFPVINQGCETGIPDALSVNAPTMKAKPKAKPPPPEAVPPAVVCEDLEAVLSLDWTSQLIFITAR